VSGKYVVGAFCGVLVISASAADLSAPAPSRQTPNTVQLRQSPPSSIITNHDRPERVDVRWGIIFLGPSTAFNIDPSGVIGGSLFNDDYQFSPDWLTGR
jgi:hypothetical protein